MADNSEKPKRFKNRSNYALVQQPDHAKASYYGNVLEHILVMEEYLGRPLPSGTIVHHRNRKRDDNRIENLLLMRNQDDHLALHRAMEANQSDLVAAHEKWAFDFMHKLKSGLPLEECYKDPIESQKVIEKPKQTILRKVKP